MSTVIELEGLGVRFGRNQILKDLRGSFSGQSVGLLGPNGAGKTTLLHTLLGFHSPSSGTARIFGHDIVAGGRHWGLPTGWVAGLEEYVEDPLI